MCELIGGLVLCSGTLGYTPTLEPVSLRRFEARATWGGLASDPAGYAVLVGVEDCDLLGREGHLFAADEIYTALVADCKQAAHGWPSPYYLGDVSEEGLCGKRGWLVLR